jgi:cytochrome c peroxidase
MVAALTRGSVLGCVLLAVAGEPLPAAEQPTAAQVRDLLRLRVGDLRLLRVPARDVDLPQPRRPDGSIDPRFAITPAKRELGKMLFFDPVRSSDIRPEFGGVPATRQTASCGSCHLGAAASKAGVLFNLAVGGEGFGYLDPSLQRFVVRRRPRPGLVDEIPTPLDLIVGGVLVRSGRFDAIDSLPRLSPSVIGFAFNLRLLAGGVAGETDGPGKANLNPYGLPAGENVGEIAFSAHRMAGAQGAALRAIPAYVRLFRDAFPQEAAAADAAGDPELLINDHTVARAIAAFLRTVVTRDTPWDRFLAGDDAALTRRQLRGAFLFAAPAGEGGAGCISCHSGPMLNKVLGDERGLLVRENFHNVGIGDHPLQDLARAALGDPSYRDIGRAEATGDPADLYKVKTPTLRQLRDGGQYTHAGRLSSVREVVRYFNDGVPQDATAGAAASLAPLFVRPRGAGWPAGLGLTPAEIEALVDFLENALYDSAFGRDDPDSPTAAFDPTRGDLSYSIRRPDLVALGAVDGLMPSGLAPFDDDPLARRDLGIDLLDVTAQLQVIRSQVPDGPPPATRSPGSARTERLTLVNRGVDPIDTDLMLVLSGLPPGVELTNADGVTLLRPAPAMPYRRMFLQGGLLPSGGSLDVMLHFHVPAGQRPDFTPVVFSGQATP